MASTSEEGVWRQPGARRERGGNPEASVAVMRGLTDSPQVARGRHAPRRLRPPRHAMATEGPVRAVPYRARRGGAHSCRPNRTYKIISMPGSPRCTVLHECQGRRRGTAGPRILNLLKFISFFYPSPRLPLRELPRRQEEAPRQPAHHHDGRSQPAGRGGPHAEAAAGAGRAATALLPPPPRRGRTLRRRVFYTICVSFAAARHSGGQATAVRPRRRAIKISRHFKGMAMRTCASEGGAGRGGPDRNQWSASPLCFRAA